jgi:hypothetical protein
MPSLYRSAEGTLKWQVVEFQNKIGDCKVYSRTGHEEEWWYKSTFAFTSALDPGRFTPEKKTRYRFTGVWVGPRTGLDR